MIFKFGATSYFFTTYLMDFLGHENDWVTVYNQEIIEYGKEYSDDELIQICLVSYNFRLIRKVCHVVKKEKW
jgi:hypothetical protein